MKFCDADFANLIQVKSQEFDNKTFAQARDLINVALTQAGFNSRHLFEIGQLTAKPDFDMALFLIRPGSQVSIRTHNHEEARKVYYYLKNSHHRGRRRFLPKFGQSVPVYYDGAFSTPFETQI